DFEFMLRDSRARALFVSKPLLATFEPLLAGLPAVRHVFVGGDEGEGSIGALLRSGGDDTQVEATCADDACFWLYSSGSTGTPKGTVHLHSHLIQTAELYGNAVLGIRESDVVFSAAKLFFA